MIDERGAMNFPNDRTPLGGRSVFIIQRSSFRVPRS